MTRSASSTHAVPLFVIQSLDSKADDTCVSSKYTVRKIVGQSKQSTRDWPQNTTCLFWPVSIFHPPTKQFGIIFTTFHHLRMEGSLMIAKEPKLADFLHFRLVIPALLSVSKRAPAKTFFAERPDQVQREAQAALHCILQQSRRWQYCNGGGLESRVGDGQSACLSSPKPHAFYDHSINFCAS